MGVTVLSGCERPGPQNQEAPPPSPRVTVASVGQQAIPIYKDYVGLTEGKPNVPIRARVEGFLDERLFDEGTIVREGWVLYRIDDGFLKARVEREQAELARTRAVKTRTGSELIRIKPSYESNGGGQERIHLAEPAGAGTF